MLLPLSGHFKEVSRFFYNLASRWSMKTWHFHNSLGSQPGFLQTNSTSYWNCCFLPCSLKDLGSPSHYLSFSSYRSKGPGRGSTRIPIFGIIASPLLHLQKLKSLEVASQERWSQFISITHLFTVVVNSTTPVSVLQMLTMWVSRPIRAFDTVCVC